MKFITFALLLGASTSFAQIDLINEDFESGIPVSFSIVDNDGLTPHSAVDTYTEAWISTVDPEDASNTVASSTSYFDPVGKADRWMITPQVTLGAFGNFISWKALSHDPSYVEDYVVLVSTTDAQMESFTDTLLFVDDENPTWTRHTFDLTEEGYANQSVHFAFVHRTYDGFKFYVDSIHVWKEDPVSVPEQVITSVQLSPNPTSSTLSINSETPIKAVSILSLSGNEVLRSSENTFNVETLVPGVYVALIETTQGIVRQKFIKN